MQDGRRQRLVVHMHMFGGFAYAMVSDEKKGKVNAKGNKCMSLSFCEGMKAYRLICLKTKKIIKSDDVIFVEDSERIKKNLEMHPSGRNEGPMVVVMVDESFESPMLDGSGQTMNDNKQVGGNGVTIEELHKTTANNDIIIESSNEGRRPFEDWWKNHILAQRGEERANVTIFEDDLS